MSDPTSINTGDLALLEVIGPIATLSLNRPESRNALSIELLRAAHERIADLRSRLESQASEQGVKVLILTGAGKSFCAGMDLKQVLADPANPGTLLGLLADLCIAIRELPCVTIARVKGAAIGGGCGLTTVCDFSVTHDDAKMGFPEVDLGVCPAVVAPWLVRRIGPGPARAILLRGGLMSGREAFACGIVTQSMPTPAELDVAVNAIAERVASGGAAALRATKALLNQLDGSGDRVIAKRAAELSASVIATPEAQASLRAKLGT